MPTRRVSFSLSLGIAALQSECGRDPGLIMAGAALGGILIVTIFVPFQNTFTQGIALGAGKG